MGVKRSNDLLEQITWGLAITLIVLTLSTSFLIDMSSSEEGAGSRSINVERAQERGTLPQGGVAPAPVPGAIDPGTTAPATTDTTP
jgi:preprotein translocase subunit SecG